MANKLYIEQDIQNIANSIRSKNGLSTLYKVSEMSSAINNLPVLSEDTITGTTNTQVSLSNVVKDKELIVNGKAVQDGTPTPDTPKEISVVENVSVESVGKNLIPFTNQDFTLNNVRYYVQNGSLYINGTSKSETSSKNQNFKNNFSFTLPSGTYTISQKSTVGLYLFDIEGNNILDNPDYITSGGRRTITLENQMQLFFGFYVYQKTFPNINAEVMINNGTTALPYEPYKSSITPIDLKGNFLGALPNGVKDELKIVNGKASIIKRVGKVVLDGSESWSKYTNTDIQGNTYGFYTNLNDIPKQNSVTNNFALSNRFIQIVRSDVSIIDTQGIYLGSGKVLYIKITQSLITDGTPVNFKTWLSTHNTIVYYELETPTTIDLGRVPILTIDGTNNLTIYANLNTNFSLKYGKVI